MFVAVVFEHSDLNIYCGGLVCPDVICILKTPLFPSVLELEVSFLTLTWCPLDSTCFVHESIMSSWVRPEPEADTLIL